MRARFVGLVFILSVLPLTTASFSQTSGSRPGYIYDTAEIISSEYENRIDQYVRQLDDANTAEIVVYTIPTFVGHGIAKDGQEIRERDMLANYIFNEVPLDGVKGIGKAGKDNGVLVLLSLERDSGGGSMRIEVGRGLEGNITDGTAGEILDSFLVPARNEYESSGDARVFDKAFLDTVVSLGSRTGYQSSDPTFQPPSLVSDGQLEDIDIILDYAMPVIFAGFIVLVFVLSWRGRKNRRRRFGPGYVGWGGGSGGGFGGGGGGGGGGGSSGGGGAGR